MSSVNHTSTSTRQAIHHQSGNEAEERLQEWRGRSVTNTEDPNSQRLLPREAISSEKTEPTDSKARKLFKRPRSEVIDLTQADSPIPERVTKRKRKEIQMVFVHGTDDHIDKYVKYIDEAESHIIIASWNLNFIPREIFLSLMRAKRREVSISLVVQSVKREETLNCFYENEDEEDSSNYNFDLFETKSHAKFLFVDSKVLILGSYNALGDSYEESLDTSVVLKGSVEALWPFYMSIRETYTLIGEDLSSIFGGIAMISKLRNPGPRQLLQRSLEDHSRISLLRTVQEHEDFFRLATPYNGDVSIYSPFSTRDNTLKRLQALDRILPSA